jgi:hypothetical protein
MGVRNLGATFHIFSHFLGTKVDMIIGAADLPGMDSSILHHSLAFCFNKEVNSYGYHDD